VGHDRARVVGSFTSSEKDKRKVKGGVSGGETRGMAILNDNDRIRDIRRTPLVQMKVPPRG